MDHVIIKNKKHIGRNLLGEDIPWHNTHILDAVEVQRMSGHSHTHILAENLQNVCVYVSGVKLRNE